MPDFRVRPDANMRLANTAALVSLLIAEGVSEEIARDVGARVDQRRAAVADGVFGGSRDVAQHVDLQGRMPGSGFRPGDFEVVHGQAVGEVQPRVIVWQYS